MLCVGAADGLHPQAPAAAGIAGEQGIGAGLHGVAAVALATPQEAAAPLPVQPLQCHQPPEALAGDILDFLLRADAAAAGDNLVANFIGLGQNLAAAVTFAQPQDAAAPLLVGGPHGHQPAGTHPGDVAAVQALPAAAAGALRAVQQLGLGYAELPAAATAAVPEAAFILLRSQNLQSSKNTSG